MDMIAEMWSFGGRGAIRNIEIPAEEIAPLVGHHHDTIKGNLLELAFKYGQNMFQPRKVHSLSVGDIVNLPAYDCGMNVIEQHIVLGMGWYKLNTAEYLDYIAECLKGDREAREAVWKIEEKQRSQSAA